MGRKISAERYSRIRARVEDGKIWVGSPAHLEIIDFDLARRDLSPRSREAVRLSLLGHSHVLIADELGLSRSRVSHLLGDFFDSLRDEDLADRLRGLR